MKRSIPLCALLLLLSTVSSTAQWVRQYPMEKLENVLDIDISNEGFGFAAGTNDLLLRYEPSTSTWTLLEGFGEDWDFEAVDYLEGSNGNIAVAGGDGLIMTLDKGAHWNEITGAPSGIHVIKLFAQDHLIAIGDTAAYEWKDNQWTDLLLPVTSGIKGGFILDEQHLWAFTTATNPVIYYSTNGGQTWDDNLDIEDIDVVTFYDALNGIATDGRKVYNTTNGGVNWTLISTNEIHNTSNDIIFGDSQNILMAATLNADPALSTDGGLTWTQLSTDLINQRSYSIASLSDTEFIVGNDLTGMAYSDDQGATWMETSGPTRNIVQDVFFLTRAVGFAVGQNGMYLTTRDGGQNWEDHSEGSRSHLAIHGLSENNLWIGANQRILHSVDTGNTWTESLIILGGGINDVLAVTNELVMGVSSTGIIYRTDDGGAKWDTVYNSGNQLRSIAKITDQQFMATGFGGVIVRSDDAGLTWNPVTIPEAGLQYEQAYFLNGEGWLVTSSFKKLMWHTDNAGNTWTPIDLPIDRFWDGVYFMSPDTGIIVGRATNEGRVYITYSGGQSWQAGYITSYPLYGTTGVPHPNGSAWIFGYGSDIEALPYCDVIPMIGQFKGDLGPCEKSTQEYSVVGTDTENYMWSFPSDWTIIGNPNNDTVHVVVGESGPISVRGSNACGQSNILAFNTFNDEFPELVSLDGDSEPCAGAIDIYLALGLQVDEYIWTLPSDWVILDVFDGFVDVVVGQQPGFVQVVGRNECGDTPPQSLEVTPFVEPVVNIIVNGNQLSLSEDGETYQWFLDGVEIAGATGATYTATENGSYHATIDFPAGCSVTTEAVDIIISAVIDHQPIPVTVFPVPAKDKLFVSGIKGEHEFSISDATGRIIEKGTWNEQAITVSQLPGGMYLLVLKNAEQTYVGKFVRE